MFFIVKAESREAAEQLVAAQQISAKKYEPLDDTEHPMEHWFWCNAYWGPEVARWFNADDRVLHFSQSHTQCGDDEPSTVVDWFPAALGY